MATLALSDADVALWRRKIFTEINVELDVPWFVICGQQLFAAKKIVKETFDGFAVEEKTHFFLVSISMIPQSLFFSISLCASILSLSLFLYVPLLSLSHSVSILSLSLSLFLSHSVSFSVSFCLYSFSLFFSLILSLLSLSLCVSFSLSFCLYCLSLFLCLYSLSLSLSLSLYNPSLCLFSLSVLRTTKSVQSRDPKNLKSKSLLIWRN